MAKRIWMISDTHLGCRSNSVLWLTIIEDYFFNFFIPLAKAEYKEGDILYHLGDVFDNRQSINLAEHERETIESYSEDIDYVFCHSETQGVQTSPSTRHLHEGGNSVDLFKKFKRVYSGHIHYRQKKKNFVLVGNPYQMTRSDRGNQKGVYLLDLDSGKDTFFENNSSPKFIKYYINDIFNIRMEELAKEIKGNFVDIYIPSKFLLTCSINRFMDQLDGLAHRLEPKIFDEEYAAHYEDGEITDFSGDIDLIKISEEYVNGLDYDDDLKKRLILSIKNLYTEATTSKHEDF